MNTDVSASDAVNGVPATSEFGLAWTTYVLFGIGVLIWWPSVLGVVLCHVRAGSVAAGFLGTHYRWLIRTFWWSLLGYLVGGGILVASAWPILRDIITAARAHQDGGPFALDIDWSSLFATAGLAGLGGVVLLAVWGWNIYRVFRGAIRLANAQPAP